MFDELKNFIVKNKKVLIVVGLIVVIPLFIVMLLPRRAVEKVSTPVPTPNPPIRELNGKTRIILNAFNNSGRDGWAIFEPVDGQMWLNINIDAEEIPEDDHDFPATLRRGYCSNPGEVKYTLTPVYNGGSETTLGISLDQLRVTLPLSLVIEQSSTDKTVVSCGDIIGVY